MAANDIGIDLGTSSVIIYAENDGILLNESTVVAVDSSSNAIIAIGNAAHEMVGRTPPNIQAIWPLSGGVISDHVLTREIIKALLNKVRDSRMVKPRVSVCVPAAITGVEADAVVEAVQSAGARQVYLIDEPIAAAIGAGIDIMKPFGHLVIDIGGGTTDIAVISMGGKVQTSSIKIAGNTIDQAIIKHIYAKYNLNIGPRMAEKAKIAVGCCTRSLGFSASYTIKGLHAVTGLPQKITIETEDLYEPILENISQTLVALRTVLERTPPELSGDIYMEGITLTGGGALLKGFAEYLSEHIAVKVQVNENAQFCVAIGAGKSFALEGQLEAGFRDATGE